MSTTIYAIHTPDADGSPMNETALCADHLSLSDTYLSEVADADDRPDNLTFTVVTHPESNDTVCLECQARTVEARERVEARTDSLSHPIEFSDTLRVAADTAYRKRAIQVAAETHAGDVPTLDNSEYLRGQTELIADIFGYNPEYDGAPELTLEAIRQEMIRECEIAELVQHQRLRARLSGQARR